MLSGSTGMRRLKTLYLFIFGIGVSFMSASFVSADISCPDNFEPKSGVCFPKGDVIGLKSDPSAPVYTVLVTVMNWLLGIIGVLAVLAFVISGIQYLAAAGDEDMAETAKRNMTYAIIGLAVALAGLIVVNAVAGLLGASGVTTY